MTTTTAAARRIQPKKDWAMTTAGIPPPPTSSITTTTWRKAETFTAGHSLRQPYSKAEIDSSKVGNRKYGNLYSRRNLLVICPADCSRRARSQRRRGRKGASGTSTSSRRRSPCTAAVWRLRNSKQSSFCQDTKEVATLQS